MQELVLQKCSGDIYGAQKTDSELERLRNKKKQAYEFLVLSHKPAKLRCEE